MAELLELGQEIRFEFMKIWCAIGEDDIFSKENFKSIRNLYGVDELEMAYNETNNSPERINEIRDILQNILLHSFMHVVRNVSDYSELQELKDLTLRDETHAIEIIKSLWTIDSHTLPRRKSPSGSYPDEQFYLACAINFSYNRSTLATVNEELIGDESGATPGTLNQLNSMRYFRHSTSKRRKTECPACEREENMSINVDDINNVSLTKSEIIKILKTHGEIVRGNKDEQIARIIEHFRIHRTSTTEDVQIATRNVNKDNLLNNDVLEENDCSNLSTKNRSLPILPNNILDSKNVDWKTTYGRLSKVLFYKELFHEVMFINII